jgi:large subunit ribosomal protein L24
MKSVKPRKQRKELFHAPLHKQRKWIAAHLEENLMLKYDRRSVSVVKGDTVRVMRGSFKGHENKVANVHVRKRYLEIEGLTLTKADGNKVAKPIHPSNVLITKLNLTDKWRRQSLERYVPEETKKEIEKEASQQLKELEEEQRRQEEELARLAEEEAAEEELEEEEEPIEEEPSAEPVPKEKPAEEKPAKTPSPKKQEIKEEAKEPSKKPEKKPAAKPSKGTTKEPAKKSAKKTPEKKTTSSKKKTSPAKKKEEHTP